MQSFFSTDVDYTSNTEEEQDKIEQALENNTNIPVQDRTEDPKFIILLDAQHEEEDPYAFEDLQQLGGALQEDDELLQSFKNLCIEDQ